LPELPGLNSTDLAGIVGKNGEPKMRQLPLF
jgi:hypothetical protein